MNKTFRTLLGATVMVAGSAVAAQAANTYYTWELSGLTFGPVMPYDDFDAGGWDDGLVVPAYTPDGGTASGTMVLKYNGSSWSLGSVSITTGASTAPTPGMGGTSYYSTYSGSLNPAVSSLFLVDSAGEYTFELNWAPNLMTSAIGGALIAGKSFGLDWVSSWESQVGSEDGLPCSEDDYDGCLTFYTRANGYYYGDGQEPDGMPGTWSLRSVTTDTPVPEPATMALFATGLLGLAAVRRRRAR